MMFEPWKDVWKDIFEKNKEFQALLTNLSKGFDCICHDLLIAKLHAYGLDISRFYFRIIYQTVSKELKKIPFLVPWKIFYLEHQKTLSWVLSFVQYFYV